MTEITESEIVMRDVITQKSIHQMGIEVAGVVIMTITETREGLPISSKAGFGMLKVGFRTLIQKIIFWVKSVWIV